MSATVLLQPEHLAVCDSLSRDEPQAPFVIDGAGECDDSVGARNAMAPWWVPVSFRTSSRGPASWTSFDACAPGLRTLYRALSELHEVCSVKSVCG